MNKLVEGISPEVAYAVFYTFKDIEPYKSKMKATQATVDNIEENLKTKTDFCYGIYVDDVCVGAIWGLGSEIAMAIVPKYKTKWATKELVKDFFDKFFKNNAFAMVSVESEKAEKFIKSLGFKKEGEIFYLDKQTYEDKWSK